MIETIARYWNEHIHDLEMTRHTVGTREFFDDLDDYRFDKLHYLRGSSTSTGSRGRRCSRSAAASASICCASRAAAHASRGSISATTAIELATQNLALHGLAGAADLRVANGEALPFADGSFDVVYAHGVVQYTADPHRLVREGRRVLKPGGHAIFMVYNRLSWLNAMSMVMGVGLEHEDAPVLRKFSIGEFRELLQPFGEATIVPERFPVKSRLHGGVKGWLYNTAFVGAFNTLPRPLVRRFGWHLMGLCRK